MIELSVAQLIIIKKKTSHIATFGSLQFGNLLEPNIKVTYDSV